jgi:methionyl aminopeptidase
MLTKPKTQTEIHSMRESGRMLATVLEVVKHQTKSGVSTKDLANIAATELKKLGGEPSFLGYQGFPDILCVSLNDEVVHGIPRSDRFVNEGDIVSLDFGVTYKGMITDSAISFICGVPQVKDHQTLVDATKESLMAGIKAVKSNCYTGDIGEAVQKVLDRNHYGIVRDLVGHGVGHYLHEDPNVPNYGSRGTGFNLKKNMTIAIEPMATLGGYHVYIDNDGWTVKTEDGSWAAHFEHSILITDDGAEILTKI